MLRVQEPALEPPLEHPEDGLPVDAGRLHPDQRHLEARQPVGELLELSDRRAEALRLLRASAPALALPRHPHRGDDAVAVHVQPRAALNDDVHHVPPFQTTGRAGSEGPPTTTLRFALEAAVSDSAGPRTILTIALAAARRCRRRPIRRRHSHPAAVTAAPAARATYHRSPERETRASGGPGDHESRAKRRKRPKTIDRVCPPAPALVFPQCSLAS